MKRFIIFLLCAIVLCSQCCLFGVNASAAYVNGPYETVISRTVIPLEDGGRIIETVYSEQVSTYAASYHRAGTKESVYEDAFGNVMLKLRVHGTFIVTPGVGAVCISASHDHEIYGSTWRYVNGSSHASANKAFGNATFKQVVDFITPQTLDVNVVLTCDENGNLS